MRPGTRLCSSRFLQATTASAPPPPLTPADHGGDASPRFPPDDRIPDVPATIRSCPASSSTRGTSCRAGRCSTTPRGSSASPAAREGVVVQDDLGDGATPVGSGAFGWTAEGPARSSSRASSQAARRAHDTHARESRAGAISSWPLGSSPGSGAFVAPDLSAPRLCAISPPRTCSPRPPWTPPRRVCRVDQRRPLLEQILGAMYPALLTREFVSLVQGEVSQRVFLSCDELLLECFGFHRAFSSPCLLNVASNHRQTPRNRAMRGETGNTEDASPRAFVRSVHLPSGRRGSVADELQLPNSPAPEPNATSSMPTRSAHAEDAWRAIVAPGDDGDACYLGFADTTLLDFVSRGLDNKPEKRVGDFEHVAPHRRLHRTRIHRRGRQRTAAQLERRRGRRRRARLPRHGDRVGSASCRSSTSST